jgi:hypothetical protein
MASVRKRTIPTERPPLVSEVSAKFLRIEGDESLRPYSRLSRPESLFLPPRRGWVDPVTDPLLIRKSGSTGNRIGTSGSVARNSDHWTTDAVTTFWTIFKNSARTSLKAHYFSATHITPLTRRLYSQVWVDPVPDLLLFFIVPGNDPGTLTSKPQKSLLILTESLTISLVRIGIFHPSVC